MTIKPREFWLVTSGLVRVAFMLAVAMTPFWFLYRYARLYTDVPTSAAVETRAGVYLLAFIFLMTRRTGSGDK